MFFAEYNTSQFITSRHVVLKSHIPINVVVNNEPTEDTVMKSTGEASPMEECMNPKDFQKI
jgi:hypothetical protein